MSETVVYLLVSDRRTYIGATKNMSRRLRQHNGEIKGGAKATHGRQWAIKAKLNGFPDGQEGWKKALSVEWRAKRKERSRVIIRGESERLKRLRQLAKVHELSIEEM